METELISAVIAIVFLIVFSGFFSGSETSLTATSASNMHKMSKEGDERAGLVEKLISDPESLIGAILLGNNLVNILASALATYIFIELFGELGVVYATFAMTAVVLIFAEVMPKTYAISNPEKVAIKVAPIINVFVIVLSPIVRLIQLIARATLRLFGINTRDNQKVLTPHDEIRGAIDLQAHEGGIVKEHKDMLAGILDLEEISVEDVMVHRKNVETINADDDIDDIFLQIVSSPYTRLPVWRDDPDNIIGIVHAKDVLRTTRRNKGELCNDSLNDIISEPWFVPETTTLRDQLKMFLAQNAHFAIVVDEYGALMGVISLEDILEEIVGDIADEHDTLNSDVTVLKSGAIVAEGLTPIRDLNRQFNWSLSDEEATTIAGYIIDEAEIIPLPGQEYKIGDFNFEILKRKRNQITLVKIHPPLAE
ncbi:HlyC/CorC family transporter [Pseudemcibacter aquimaris]|uniref:HlyC/CorC family transporter n=1 Tax=Pseudemcibacter aquimaris TaxID=2857064 RepID=UPI0020135287|nr:HlyC/CorC family transporter [Pseudemcibacter aquimaris]MCC3861817.1 HlyC/CorC family transporter [Pseudemcibacter aquimaris]WDU58572.1 HlyC/CorC family transporter [Pseudemcibacter aquimaris]